MMIDREERERVRLKFGLRLYRTIKRHNLTARQVAERSGIAKQYVSYICNGQRSPTLTILIKLKEAIGCEWEELLGDL